MTYKDVQKVFYFIKPVSIHNRCLKFSGLYNVVNSTKMWEEQMAHCKGIKEH